MSTSVDKPVKYAEYKIAPPLDKSKRSLVQGKLSTPTSGAHSPSQHGISFNGGCHDYLSLSHSPLLSHSVSSEPPDSSPRRPLLPHSTGYPTTDHTHSLSLSLSDPDSPPPTHSHSLHAPAAVIPQSSTDSVLTVRAQDSTPSHSNPVKTTSTKTLSPVKVTRHFYKEDQERFDTDPTTIAPPPPPSDTGSNNWRRFSSNFISPPLPHTAQQDTTLGGGEEGEQRQPFLVQSEVAPLQTTANQSDTHSVSTRRKSSVKSADHNSIGDDSQGVESVSGGGVEGVSGGGVGRSVSDQGLKRVKEQSSVLVHSKSADLSSSDQHKSVASGKRKASKGRHVASRYMSDISSARKPPPSHGKNTPPGSTVARKNKTTSKPPPHKPVESHRPTQRKPVTTVKQLPVSARTTLSAHPATPSHKLSALSVSFSPSGIVTSTPAPSHGGGSSNDGSFLVMDTASDLTTSVGDTSRKQTQGMSKANWLELLHTRLQQSVALNVMSAQSLREQDQEAKSQLYTLWKAVEDKKQTKLDLMKSLETERRNLALDKTMDIQLQGLGPVVSGLSQLERSHSAMARALDTTRHDLALSGMLPVDEEQLTVQLARTEELLGDIMKVTRTKVPKVTSFAECTNAAVTTLSKEIEQLQTCWFSLEAVTKLQLYEASVYLEQRQRTSA